MRPIEELATLILMLLFAVWILNLLQGNGWTWIQSKFFTSYQQAGVQQGQSKVAPTSSGLNPLGGQGIPGQNVGGQVGTSAGVSVGNSIGDWLRHLLGFQ